MLDGPPLVSPKSRSSHSDVKPHSAQLVTHLGKSRTEEGLGPHPKICHPVFHPEYYFREHCLRISSSSLCPGLCHPHTPSWAKALELISSLSPASPGSRPPTLWSPGPFSGLVYKNCTAPVYTALKGVRSCCPRRGCPHSDRPLVHQWPGRGSGARLLHAQLWAGSSALCMSFQCSCLLDF